MNSFRRRIGANRRLFFYSLILLLSLLFITNLTLAQTGPTFTVWPEEDRVEGWGWSADGAVTITFAGDSFSPDAGIDGDGNFRAEFWGEFDIQPGMVMTITDGASTKTHTVTNLTIVDLDPDADTVSGTANAYSEVDVWLCDAGHIYRHESADGSGQWTADFSVPGDDPSEQDLADLQPGICGDAAQGDADGDATQLWWRVPRIDTIAYPEQERVQGDDWPLGAMVTLIVDDPGTPESPDLTLTDEVQQADWLPNQTYIDFDLSGYLDLRAGIQLTLENEDGTIVRHHTVTELVVTEIDLNTNTVYGTAAPNSGEIYTSVHQEDAPTVLSTADIDGNWQAEFTPYGFLLQPGDEGWTEQRAEDGETDVSWRADDPHMVVRAPEDQVTALQWPADVELTMTIAQWMEVGSSAFEYVDVHSDTQTTTWANPHDGYTADFDLGGVDLMPGHRVTISLAGYHTAVHVVRSQEVTAVYPETDIVTGTADPDTEVMVWVEEPCCFEVEERIWADGDGNWSVNFSGIVDIGPGSQGSAVQQNDNSSDHTRYDWFIANPTIGVWAEDNRVEGWGWPEGTIVALTINDPGSGSFFTAEAEVTQAEWDPNETHVYFELGEEFDIQPGFPVTLSDGATTKNHTVTDLMITNIDAQADVVHGTAGGESQVDVWVCDEEGCANRHVQASAGDPGEWSADFANPGPGEDEQDTKDIGPGVGGDAAQFDEDGDGTFAGIGFRERILHVVPAHPEVHGHDWPWEAEVTLTIDNDDDPGNGFLFQETKFVWDDPWCGEPCFDLQGVFEVLPGHFVFMSDDQATVMVEVTALEWSGVDYAADTVWGTAEPGTDVWVDIHEEDGASLQVTTGVDGQWLADFGGLFDLQAGMGGRSIQFQNPGEGDNGTLAYWPQPLRLVSASLSPNPVAVEQGPVTLAATYDGIVGAMQFVIADYSNWEMMCPVDGQEPAATDTCEVEFEAPAVPGAYPILVQASRSGEEWSEPALVGILAVYDPNGGFATGGGQFIPGGGSSYDDDYLPNIDGLSPAVFGFNVKYKKGAATVPSGHLMFMYRQGDFKLKSADFDWLAITNSVWAKFKGTATVDGYEGLFPFRVDARDSDKLGGSQADRFIIKIWAPNADPDRDKPIYRASGNVQGQIVIHNKKDPALMLGGLFEFSSGLDLSFGSANGVDLAVRQANEAGGVLGSPVALFFRDAGDSSATTESALDLIENRGVQALLGPGFSSNTMAILESIVVPSEVILTSPSNTLPDLAQVPDEGLYFRTSDSESYTYIAAALRACETGPAQRAVVLVGGQEPWQASALEAFMNTFRSACGGTVERIVAVHEHGDPAAALEAAFEGLDPPPDMTFVATFDRDLNIHLIQEAFCQNDADGIPLSGRYWSFQGEYTLDDSFSQEVIAGIPCQGELDPDPAPGDLAGYEQNAPIFVLDYGDEAFMTAYATAFDGQDSTVFSNLAYDAAALTMLAAEEAGSVDPLAIRAHMVSVSTGGVATSDLAGALEMIRDGIDIDWQGTFSDALVHNYNHDYQPDGETISPQIVFRLNADGIPEVDRVFDPDELIVEPQPLSMVLPYHDYGAGRLVYTVAAHKLGSLLQAELGVGLDVSVPPGNPGESLDRTIAAVIDGQADLTLLTWLPYLWLHEMAGVEPAVGHLRFGDYYYYSQFYTRFDSGITSLPELTGEHLCWVDPSSTSGYVIPSLMLRTLGIDGDADSEFIGSHTQLAQALYYETACAAGAAFWDVRDLVAESEGITDIKDIVLALGPRSPGIPAESFVFGSNFPEELRDEAVAALVAIAGPYSEPDLPPPGFEAASELLPGYEGLVAFEHSAYLGLLALISDAGMTVEEVYERYMY